ncbi:uncharacterized protein LOC130425787 [Triplophysa dalaica]|uniref:uncharacterized protein LOC130425787 n=1 Tax=Triplophysa dalaica TaxID=1582913 RepID=UPI0024E036B8|nr:uncharacterized protein LOC130425787 [Triplophysa dalaica]
MEFSSLLLVLLLFSTIHSTEPADVKPSLTVRPQSVFTGDSVTLTCEVHQSTGWKFIFYTPSHENYEASGTKTIKVYYGGEYWCRARRGNYYSHYSDPITVTVEKRPKPQVSVWPDGRLFRGETVNLTCDISEGGITNWLYAWYKDSNYYTHRSQQKYTISSVSESHAGQYTCKGTEIRGPSDTSDAVTLTVSDLPRVTVRVTPDTSVFTGETVTLKYSNIFTISSASDQDEFWCRGERAGRPSSSQDSDHVTLSVKGSKPKAELTSDTEGSVLTGNTVTLTCLMNQFTGWKFNWYQHTQNTEKSTTDTNTYTMSNVRVSDGGQYWCRAGRGNPVYYTDYSDVLWINVTESPKAVLSVEPDKQLFSGETVILRCDIQTKQDTEWTYSWTVKPYNTKRKFNCETQECKIRVNHHHSGEYSCMGKIKDQNSEKSEAVTLTVSSYKPKTLLRVSPQQWLTEGDSVTLMCEVNRSSTGWTFSWFTEHNLSSGYDLVSDSSGGSKGNYTVSSAALKHTGVYMCGAERGDPVYHTHNSSTQPLWITGVSSSVSLIIRPNRTQHFSSESLSLSCEDHRNSTGWTVRRYTNTLETCSSSSVRSTGTESTCTIRSLITSDTGVYWCESESGHKLHPVNISIHNGDVILDSPVHPVTEGDSLTLHCLYGDKNPSNLRAEFYKDGSVVQNQTTGDMMIISTVSKSHEGFYYCKHPERGESPKSWISVTVSSPRGLLVGVAVGLSFMFMIIVLVLVLSYRNKKGKVSESPSSVSAQQNISQTSDQKQSEDTPLQSVQSSSTYDAHIYDSVGAADNKNTSTAVTVSGPSDELYSQVERKKHKSKDNVSAEADLTYAEIELKPKKEVKKKKEKKDVVCGSNDVTYAQIKWQNHVDCGTTFKSTNQVYGPAPDPELGRKQSEEAVCRVGGITCNTEGFAGETGSINVLEGGRDTNDLFSCSHYVLKGLAAERITVDIPHSDAASQKTLGGASVKGADDGSWGSGSSQPAQFTTGKIPFHFLPLIRTTSGHGEPVPISGVIGHQGRIHPGWSANPSQGTHTHSFTHSRTHTLRTIFPEMPINLPCMSLDQGRKPEYPEETPEARGEHANSTHTSRKRESDPQPWRCEANVLTTKPPCPPTDIKPSLTVKPQSSVFTGDSVTLTCEVHQSTGWKFIFITPSQHESIEASGTKTISSVQVSDGGEYMCRARKQDVPKYYTQDSEPKTVTVKERPKAEVSVEPGDHVFSGETVTLSCFINGGGVTSWQYSWYKDDLLIQQNKQQKYTISSVSESDRGKYTCRGTEADGSRSSDTSDAVTLRVSDVKPSLTVRAQSVFTGDSVTLTCEVHQSTGWEFIFTTPSQHEYYEASGTKTISSVRVSDGGEYKCRARRGNPSYLTPYSEPKRVTVEERPKAQVSVQPGEHVFGGQTVTLTCDINGETSVTIWQYIWNKDDLVIQQNKQQKYTISSVSESDASQYTCRGKEIRGLRSSDTSDTVTLTVSDIPKPSLTVRPQSVFTGDSVTLTCEVHQSTGWKFIFYTPSQHGDYEASGTKTIKVSDGGEYKCRARRGNYNTYYSDPITVTVEKRPKPQVSVWPDRRLFRGETVTLTCDISEGGVTNWLYTWYKDSNYYTYRSQQKYTISSVSESHAGQYTCKGTEIRGPSDTSDAVTLTVSDKPKPSLTVRPQSVFTGDSVTLTCEVHQSTGWKFIFYTPSQHGDYEASGTKTIKVSDGGEYKCSARRGNYNTYYSDPITVTVEKRPKPQVSVWPDGRLFRGETVTLTCDISGGGVTKWQYSWYKDSNYYTHSYQQKYTISSVSESHAGQYTCRGTEIRGPSDTSDAVTLTVSDLPRATLTVTPHTSVFTGETVTLKCEIEAQYRSLHWRYLWYKDRTEVYNTHPYTVNTNTLTISSVTQSDQSQFRCVTEIYGRPQTSQTSSAVHLIVIGSKPKAELTSDTEGSVLTGNTVTLTCRMNQFTGWKFNWYQHTQNTEKTTTDTNTYTMSNVRVSDGGQYWCRAGRGNPVYYTDYSDVLWINVTESPKAVLSVEPDKQLFSGETVTLRCDIQTKQDTEWTYSWTVEKYNQQYTVNRCKTQECKIRVYHSDSGHYTCRGTSVNGQNSEKSEAVTPTVSLYKPKTLLRVSPQQWLTEGDSVTLMCEVNRSSTGWTFSWFTEHNLSSGYDLVSDSSGGSKGNYTVSSAALKHTGVYMCGAERGDPVYHTHNSSTQPLWITGVSSSVSLIIRPNRTQHFSSESLSLSCEDHRNSTGWTVRRYTNTLENSSSSSVTSTGTESTCTIRSLITSDTGVYWCESESGHKLHPVNISIHNGDVILDSPVHPVTEGDSLTLHCLYRDKIPSNLRAEFYKDGSVVQNQTTGDMMIISTVSKSHEGFYYCKHPERGESPKSWISVTVSSPRGLLVGVAVGLSFMFLIIVLVLLWSYRNKKGKVSESPSSVSAQQNISQTSDQKQSEDTPLQSGQSSSTYGDSHIYDSVGAADNKNTSTAVTVSGPSDELYSQVNIKKKKRKSKDNVSAEADLTYAEIELKPKKEVKKKKEKKENNKESEDTLYSNLKMNEHRDVVCGSNDVTYAQIKYKTRKEKPRKIQTWNK